MAPTVSPYGLYDPDRESSACGVGFLTRKDSKQTHELLQLGHQALCAVPHRGGMSSEGIGDGAGVSVDLSLRFFSELSGEALETGNYGVGNFFLPDKAEYHELAAEIVVSALRKRDMRIVLSRDVPINNDAIRPAAVKAQLAIHQWVFVAPNGVSNEAFDRLIHDTLLEIEVEAYTRDELNGLYPLSMSARMQVLKGRLNSNEIVPYFADLNDPRHEIHTMYFHTRFSTNTDPHPTMAQPFRFMAHNGELNTDAKNRLSEAAIARARNSAIISPKGQSDSCRLDQTLQSRILEGGLNIVTAVVSMMPPAWENDYSLSHDVRAMLAYFALYEEKNDGPAALIFGDGQIIGARLDRLGLRPLRSVETDEYLAVMSEAGQIAFPPESVISRGRIEAGGMLYFDHDTGQYYQTTQALEMLASKRDYPALLEQARVHLADLPNSQLDPDLAVKNYKGDLSTSSRYVAYFHNQESFRFMMDPMLADGAEKISAMGYGNAINALSDNEGGVAKYFSQRFAQVTNPPLDSIREKDGMTLRVALGAKPHMGKIMSKQIILPSPLLKMADMLSIREQEFTPVADFDMLFTPDFKIPAVNESQLISAIDLLCDQVEAFARDRGGIAIISDRHISRERAALPMILTISAVNQRLIEEGLRFKISLIIESGQISSAHHLACALGFGAAAVYPLGVQLRAEEKFDEAPFAAFDRFVKAAEKSLMKTMGKVGLCTVESYSGGEFFEPNFLDTNDPVFKRYFPNMKTPVGGVGFAAIAQSAADWHKRAQIVEKENDIPILGLFKERAEGAGHSYGTAAVRGFVDLTEERIAFADKAEENTDALRLMTLNKLEAAFGIDDEGYVNTSFDRLDETSINSFEITQGYRKFSRDMDVERRKRPAALRDVLAFPVDVSFLSQPQEFKRIMMLFNRAGNNDFMIRGLRCSQVLDDCYELELTGSLSSDISRLDALAQSLVERFNESVESHWIEGGKLRVRVNGQALDYVSRLRSAPDSIEIAEVQPASEITPCLASGAMSHGALVATAHEGVAHGTNMVGGMSNSGEGGEHISRYG
ncbi:MAG: glutamate synthase central domain-containing protein, partial [Pseudomonadota bacterium]